MSAEQRIAMIGAGIFAREQHLPAILVSGNLQLVAVYSHTKASVENFVNDAVKLNYKEQLDQFYDIDNGTPVPNKGLDELLARNDIVGVIIALPILTQPDVIRKCLKAGKHVLCEKPIARNVVDAEKLVQDYFEIKKTNPKLVFSIAENWRYEPALLHAAEAVKTKIGKLRLFSLQICNDTTQDNKYYNTAWRKEPQYQGGFLLDGGVHYAAALRLIVGEVDSLSCFSRLNKDYLAPVDTVHAIIKLADGTTGTFGVSFASPHPMRNITVVGSQGAVVVEAVNNSNYKVSVTVDGKTEEQTFAYEGVKKEVAAFSNAIANGKAENLASAVEAVIDVALIETLINSSEQDGKVVKFPSFANLKSLE